MLHVLLISFSFLIIGPQIWSQIRDQQKKLTGCMHTIKTSNVCMYPWKPWYTLKQSSHVIRSWQTLYPCTISKKNSIIGGLFYCSQYYNRWLWIPVQWKQIHKKNTWKLSEYAILIFHQPIIMELWPFFRFFSVICLLTPLLTPSFWFQFLEQQEWQCLK